MTDGTEQTAQEERLWNLARLLDNTDDAVIALNTEWFVTVWNKGAERMYGWTAEEVLGHHALEVARLEMSHEERGELRRTVGQHGRWRGEVVASRKDGTQLWVELIAVALRGPGGEVTGYLGIHRDVTERKRTEGALREALRRAETILDSISDEFFALDREWRYTYVNERGLTAAARKAGITAAELVGTNIWERFPQLVGTPFYDAAHRAAREQTATELEARSPVTGRWLEARLYPSEAGLSIYLHDISARKRADEALRESRRQSKTILESITDDFVDHDWRYTYLNDRALRSTQEWLGRPISREELLGRSLWEVFPETVGSEPYVKYHEAVRDGRSVQFETYFAAKDRWFETHAYPSESGLSVYFRDVSQRKRMEHERQRRAREQMLVADLGLRALASDDLQALMDEAVELVGRTLDVALAMVAEMPPGSHEAIFRAGVGWREGVVGRGIERGHDSQAGYTLLRGEPVIAEDQANDPRFKRSALAEEHGVVSALTVMIASPAEPFGVLEALSTRRRAFSESDVSFVQAVANVLAGAVERRRANERLAEVREVERRRIARELHDQALQDLAYALALAGRRRGADGSPRESDELTAALKRVGEQLRGAVYDLRLGDERETPFHELLESLVGVHRAIAVDSEIELDVGTGVPLDARGAVGVETLRIVGEALTNARRHAGARRVRVAIWGATGKLRVEVSDDGHGFDSASALGHGITGMRERAKLLNGRLDIRSDPATGTAIRLEVPLPSAGERAADPARVLLVEDHTAVRQAIAAMFERESDFTVMGQAGSLAEARGLLHGVDVALLDLALPDGDGTDLIAALREVSPGAQAVVLTANLDRAGTARAIEAGAAGAFDKTADLEQIVDAVRRLRAGQTLLRADEVVELLRFAGRRREQEREDRQAIASLSVRECEVLQALGAGLDAQTIADRLGMSLRTERNHVARILKKLGVHSQLQAVLFALRYGVIETR
jgi:PAS domain S-box-containing protein